MIIRLEEEQDKNQVKELWNICFDDTPKFVDWFFSERWAASYGVVAEHDGKIISAMQGWPYTVNIRGKKIPALMLAGVSTHPDYRGQGIMQKCMSLFMKNAHDTGACVVFHTPANHSTFFKCLHYSISNTGFVTYDAELNYVISDDTGIADVSEEYAEELLSIYKQNICFYSGAVIRDLNDMRLKLRDYAASDAKILYVKENNRIIAYSICMSDQENITVEEFCASNNYCRDKILAVIASIGKNRNQIIKLSPNLIYDLPAGYIVTSKPTGVMAVSNISKLLSIINPCNDISVEVSDNMLPSNNGKYKLNGELFSGECDIRLDSGRLTQLIAGYSTATELINAGNCYIKDRDILEKLEKIFTKQNCYVVEEY